MVRVGIIADDYTGANDTGLQFAKKGLRTLVLTSTERLEEKVEGFDVLVVDTESRGDEREVAYEKVASAVRAMKKAGVDFFYKKIDSTLRGNIGAELDAAMDVLGASTVVVAPAFPGNGRITVGGYQLLHQVPLERTEVAHDPRSPVRESHIPTLIQGQSRRGVGYVGLAKVLDGAETLREEVLGHRRRGNGIVVVDAATQEDLRVIASAVVASNTSLLVCGSAGLAEELPEALGMTRRERRGVVILAGSVSDVTARQILRVEKVLGVKVVEFNPRELFSSEEEGWREVSRAIGEVESALNGGRDVIVRWARGRDSALEAWRYGRGLGLGEEEMGSRILKAFELIVQAVVERGDAAGLVLTGGDTAISACKALGVAATEVMEEVSPGIPAVRFVGGRGDGVWAVTKAGAFGDEDALAAAVEYLRGR